MNPGDPTPPQQPQQGTAWGSKTCPHGCIITCGFCGPIEESSAPSRPVVLHKYYDPDVSKLFFMVALLTLAVLAILCFPNAIFLPKKLTKGVL